MCQQVWKIHQWPQDWKRLFSFQSQRKAMPKNVQTTEQLHSFHMLARLRSKIFWARLQQYVNQELPDVQTGFRKGRGTRDQIANICWIIVKGCCCEPCAAPGFVTSRGEDFDPGPETRLD